MRNLILAVFLGLASPIIAHPGAGDHHHHHHEPITEAQAQTKAKSVVKSKVERGQLPDTWLKQMPAKTYKKTFKKGEEWVVEFNNPKAAEGKQTVYVFLSLTGKVLGINYTGN